MEESKGEVLIYEDSSGQHIDVKLSQETVWLSQKLMADLFNVDVRTVNEHLKNIYESKELESISTVRKFRIVQKEGSREVAREIEHYNLDAIISVGYRVNSIQGTKFRIWATKRLKDYLVEGYAINQKRLGQLQKTIQLISQKAELENLEVSEAKGLLEIIQNYTKSFVLLNQYDSSSLSLNRLSKDITYELKYEEAISAIKELKNKLLATKEATELFGNPKDESFKGVLGNIIQSFSGQYLYPSIEQQAANLLYLVIKNHPFTDGNKRIGAFLFVWFLEKNKHRFKNSGELKINDNALTALALLVAQSNPSEKELMVTLICNLIERT